MQQREPSPRPEAVPDGVLVHIYREESYDFYLMEIRENSDAYEKKRSVEVPDELVVRYKRAVDELGDVQELLREISDGQGW